MGERRGYPPIWNQAIVENVFILLLNIYFFWNKYFQYLLSARHCIVVRIQWWVGSGSCSSGMCGLDRKITCVYTVLAKGSERWCSVWLQRRANACFAFQLFSFCTNKLRKRGISEALLEEVVFEVGGEFYTEMEEKHPRQSETHKQKQGLQLLRGLICMQVLTQALDLWGTGSKEDCCLNPWDQNLGPDPYCLW